MRKDIFNGKILNEFRGIVKFSWIRVTLIFIVVGVMFLLTALFYENIDHAGRIFLYCISSCVIAIGVLFPIITVRLIKIYPKHKKITKIFIKEWVFREYDHLDMKNSYKD